MEFTFDINNLFGDEISIVTREMKPFRNVPGSPEHRSQLQKVIDQMGVASSKAQGLTSVITSAMRFGCSDHRLYVIKDAEANGGLGAVVGILKMGTRKLFVYDNMNNQHEMDPLCVLDFYIHESRQRTGLGKRLYEFMLQQENVRPAHLAIDRPSVKFQGFMQKHYNLKAKIPQVNNFVVYDGFFRDRPKEKGSNRKGCKFYKLHLKRVKDAVNKRQPNGRLPPISMDKQKELLTNVQPRVGMAKKTGEQEGGSLIAGQPTGYSRHLSSSSSPQLYQQQQPYQQQQQPYQQQQQQQQPESQPFEPPLLRRDGPSPDFINLSRTSNNPIAPSSSAPALHNPQAPSPAPAPTLVSAPQARPQAQAQGQGHGSSAPLRGYPQQSSTYGNLGTPPTDPFAPQPVRKQHDTSWNVFGIPSNPPAGQRKMQHTRLW